MESEDQCGELRVVSNTLQASLSTNKAFHVDIDNENTTNCPPRSWSPADSHGLGQAAVCLRYVLLNATVRRRRCGCSRLRWAARPSARPSGLALEGCGLAVPLDARRV
eukprot:scaffold11776_cov107-Isochrysis_galbana.AAC.2